MDAYSSLYRQLAEFPTYKAAQFQSSNVLRVTTSTVDHGKVARRTSIKTIFVASDDVLHTSISPDASEIVASHLSPSGKYLAVLREISDSKAPDGKKRFVEIWAEDKIQAAQEVTDIHGAFYTDEYLFSLSFSPSESRIVYTAEANETLPEADPFAKYRFVPDFGESFSGKKRASIFLFDWRGQGKPVITRVVPAGPHAQANNTLFGHAVFSAENRVFAIGYEHSKDGRLLGVIYCPNRQAALWEISLPEIGSERVEELQCSSSKLSSAEVPCRSPRVLFGTDGQPSLLVWVSNPAGGPHATCSSLHTKNLSTGETKTLIESVWDPKPTEFPGLYLNILPAAPFITIASKSYIVFSSTWRSRSTLLLISLEEGTVKDLTPDLDDIHYSWALLSTDGSNQLICTRSALSRPPELVVGRIDASTHVLWQLVATPELSDDLRARLNALKTTILPVPERYPTETVLLRNATSETAPCITMPHGGPHSATSTAFNAWSTAFALEGYTVSHPNYTGSTGFGEKYIKKLMGAIGTLDIGDCIATVRLLATLGLTKLGSGQQYLLGGSHGGFIIGHLIGQYPDTFSGAVLRNPVISVGEISYSDIPDWYFEESGIPYTPTALITPEVYKQMFGMSPIAHVDKVRTPVVLLIGEKDQRVATTQGKSYYYALKGRGKDVQMLCFKDDIHAIDSVDGQRVTYEAAKKLFSSATPNGDD